MLDWAHLVVGDHARVVIGLVLQLVPNSHTLTLFELQRLNLGQGLHVSLGELQQILDLLHKFDSPVGLIIAIDVEHVLTSAQPGLQFLLELLVSEVFEDFTQFSWLPSVLVKKHPKSGHNLSECLVQVEVLPFQEHFLLNVVKNVLLVDVLHLEQSRYHLNNVGWHFVVEPVERHANIVI